MVLRQITQYLISTYEINLWDACEILPIHIGMATPFILFGTLFHRAVLLVLMEILCFSVAESHIIPL